MAGTARAGLESDEALALFFRLTARVVMGSGEGEIEGEDSAGEAEDTAAEDEQTTAEDEDTAAEGEETAAEGEETAGEKDRDESGAAKGAAAANEACESGAEPLLFLLNCTSSASSRSGASSPCSPGLHP